MKYFALPVNEMMIDMGFYFVVPVTRRDGALVLFSPGGGWKPVMLSLRHAI